MRLIVCVVFPVLLLAALTRFVLGRRTRFRTWSWLRTAITLGVIIGLAILAIAPAEGLLDWLGRNGLHWRGICRGGPPDIGEHPCTLPIALVSTFSPFAMPFLLLLGVGINLVWSLTWSLLVWQAQTESRKSGFAGLRALGVGLCSAAVSFACVAAGVTAVVVVAKFGERFVSATQQKQISLAEFARAWGLPIRVEQLERPQEVRVPAYEGDWGYEWFGVPEGDALRVIKHWPKTCWYAAGELPGWLSQRLGSALAFAQDQADPNPVLVGIEVSPVGWLESSRWVTSFDEAKRLLDAGGISWRAFGIRADATRDRNMLWVVQKGYASSMRDWKPICQSTGSSVDQVLNRPIVYGQLRGLVEDKQTYERGARLPVAGATLAFAHENGWGRQRIISRADGRFALRLPVGRYHVVVSHPDWRTQDTKPGFIVISEDSKDPFWRVFLER